MSRTALAALVLALGALGASSARAMSCQNRLVTVGDAPARVRALCGEPASLTARVEQRSVTVHRRAASGVIVSETISVTVTVERWVYDFGPQRFMRELVFEDGRLLAIHTLGYGTVASREARAPLRAGPQAPATRSASFG